MKKVLWKAWPSFVGVMIAAVLLLAIEAATNIWVMKTIDSALEGSDAIFKTHLRPLILLGLLILPAQVILAFAKGHYKRKSVTHLKKHYLKGVFQQDIQTFHGESGSHYVSALTNDINTIESQYIEGIYQVVFGGLGFIVGVAVIAYISPVILGAGILMSLILAVLSSLLSRPIKKHHEERSGLLSDYTTSIKEVLSGFHIIKVNRLTEKAKSDFHQKSKSIQDKGYQIDKLYTYISALQSILGTGVMIGMVAVAVYMTFVGSITFGGMILVISNVEKVMRPLMQVGEWFPKISASSAIFNRLAQSLEVKPDLSTIQIEDIHKGFEVKNLSFSYDENQVLQDVNYTFEKGKKYLVVGPSGGGKTTLVKLMRKYLTPSSGEIFVDGFSLKDVKADAYFKLIANIEQHVFLFEDTLRNNLCLYKDIPDHHILKAMEKAGLKHFIESQDNVLDKMIYDNGKNLSGGEKSRLAIARGLLQDAKVIYLDEAFSSLDAQVAREIEKTLLDLEGITVINVSHVVFSDTQHLYDDIVNVSGKIESKLPFQAAFV